MADKDRIKCDYDDCFKYFKNEKEMKSHKKYAMEHDYCHICDINFPDDAELTLHNSSFSGKDIFLKTKKQYEKEKEDGTFWNNRERMIAKLRKEFGRELGHELGSKYGELKYHKYACKFCGMKFNCDSGRRRHMLQSHPVDLDVKCPGCDEGFTRAAGFIFHLEENQCPQIPSSEFFGYLQHKRVTRKLLEDPKYMAELQEKDVTSTIEAATDYDVTGGVSLIDLSDICESNGCVAVQTTSGQAIMKAKNNMSMHQKDSQKLVGKAVAKMNGLADSTLWPALQPSSAADGAQASGNPSELDRRAFELRKSERGSNILSCQFWNPASPDYDPNRFFNILDGTHYCPFPDCKEKFHSISDCERHIYDAHSMTSIQCPGCQKDFRKVHGLISHIENNQSCPLKKWNTFGMHLCNLSAGFLQASFKRHPDLETPEDEAFDHAYVKYSSDVPAGWKERTKTTTIGARPSM